MDVSVRIINLKKSFTSLLFETEVLTAKAPVRIGLIGDNGCGKSTFLKILAGLEESSAGQIHWSQSVRVGYLEQEIDTDSYQVSGGEQKILRLAELFYTDYNVLLLDEPDNHLDLDHKLWFEDLVRNFPGIVIVISHDRQFLENAVDRIWFLEEHKLREYAVPYTRFKDLYLGEMSSRQHLWDVQEKERLRLVDLVKRLGVQAAANDKFVGRYHSAEKRLERFTADMVESPPKQQTIKFASLNDRLPPKKTAVYIKDLSVSYGSHQVLNKLSLHVFCGEKISINAPNGQGKSTLLNSLVGAIPVNIGQITIGPDLQLGYYDQDHQSALNEHETLVGELQKSHPFTHYEAIAYLKRFLFTRNQAVSEVRFLSGGQKSRLQLAKFLSRNPQILVLDEPTNHLDIKTVTSLENYLKDDFTGTLILVSHDRQLISAVVDRQYTLSRGQLTEVN